MSDVTEGLIYIARAAAGIFARLVALWIVVFLLIRLGRWLFF